MASKSLFASLIGQRLPRVSAVSEADWRAYRLEPKHELAQAAATGLPGPDRLRARLRQLHPALVL